MILGKKNTKRVKYSHIFVPNTSPNAIGLSSGLTGRYNLMEKRKSINSTSKNLEHFWDYAYYVSLVPEECREPLKP